ncbi:hypothetical protein EJ110_NYTH42451 [Nymphaea thermarum]|nr:hypothetical protein EJ110_NYTH42451 [Nymphaea thermarum]
MGPRTCLQKGTYVLSSESEDDFQEEEDGIEQGTDDSIEELIPKISLHALKGDIIPQMMRFEGRVKGRTASILVDTGWTQNFIGEKTAKVSGCKIIEQSEFKVVIGNGNSMWCKRHCPKEEIKIQGQRFVVELFPLAMGGADLVLGMQSLKQLVKVWSHRRHCSSSHAPGSSPVTVHRTYRPTLDVDAPDAVEVLASSSASPEIIVVAATSDVPPLSRRRPASAVVSLPPSCFRRLLPAASPALAQHRDGARRCSWTKAEKAVKKISWR